MVNTADRKTGSVPPAISDHELLQQFADEQAPPGDLELPDRGYRQSG